jgi:hypothetical protein
MRFLPVSHGGRGLFLRSVFMKVQITFVEELLGTASANPEIHREFIASKAPNATGIEEEVASIGIEGSIEKAMTIFPKESGNPFLWDYQIKGFFKDACSMLSRAGDAGKDENGRKIKGTANESCKLTAYKKIIDGLIFVLPRKIPLVLPAGENLSNCERPLRGQTAQGERIALANSETAPEGTKIQIEIRCLDIRHEKAVREWLDYGVLRGIGQWRNSGKGRFNWKEIK